MSDEKNRSVPSREDHDGADNVTPSTENFAGFPNLKPKPPKQSGGGSSSGGSSGGSSSGDKKDKT